MFDVISPREFRFAALVLVGMVIMGFVACGHSSSKASSTPTGGVAAASSTASPAPSAPPTQPPATPGAVPTPGGDVAASGSGDTTVTISPATYESAADSCWHLAAQTAAGQAGACGQEWAALNASNAPGADLMNSLPMPHTVSLGAGVSTQEGVAAATSFYRWQAFQTWAERENDLVAMQDLDPPGHADPAVSALAPSGARITAVPDCNLPVALRVVKLDQAAANEIRSQGWNVVGSLAVLATYPPCIGITVTLGNGQTTNVAPSPQGMTAINPGEVQAMAPFGNVWRIEGEVSCGGGQAALQTVCGGGA